MNENERCDMADRAFAWAIDEARAKLPPGSRVRDLSNPCADYEIRFEFLSEINGQLVRTPGLTSRLGDPELAVMRKVTEHLETCKFLENQAPTG